MSHLQAHYSPGSPSKSADLSLCSCRPGTRMLHGREYVFDSGLLNQHVAREAVLSAPVRLSGLGADELNMLAARAHTVTRHATVIEDLHVHRWTAQMAARADQIIAEWCSRPEHRAVYGGARV